ncbi:hypothetical protein CCAN2_1430023 [Capnocytophaga canimorsus]|nr:hypothetical protein CCAN2_1430023 [Capnocytophaga canimorsus]
MKRQFSIAKAVIGNPSLPYFIAGFLTQRTDSKTRYFAGKKDLYER